jgi:hypothetical protein
MNSITPQELRVHAARHGHELATAIRVERARHPSTIERPAGAGPGPSPRRRPARVWRYALGGLAALAAGAGVHTAGVEARPPAPDPIVVHEPEAPVCAPEGTAPVHATPVHRRVRDRFTPVPV